MGGSSIDREDGHIGFQIAPMVDVVFVLMLFFMASAGSQVVEKQLALNLPGSDGSSHISVVVGIDANGQVSMNGKNFDLPTDHSLPALRSWFTDAMAAFGDGDPVFIRPSADARHERIVDVMNALSASGVKKLTFS